MSEHSVRVDARDAKYGIGRGLFVCEEVTAGSFVVEYSGKLIPTSTADELHTNEYLFRVSEHWTIDGRGEENSARYINHSCSPNCKTELIDSRVCVFALRDISTGEELTFDYGPEYFAEHILPKGCKCNACVPDANS